MGHSNNTRVTNLLQGLCAPFWCVAYRQMYEATCKQLQSLIARPDTANINLKCVKSFSTQESERKAEWTLLLKLQSVAVSVRIGSLQISS